MTTRVLVVEDDPTVARGGRARTCRTRASRSTQAADGVTALAIAGRARPDLVVLDLMLPGLDGLEVCRRLRESRPDLPVIMLTALGEESDRVAGLETGADDYMVKPFSPRELVLRVQSVLRRTGDRPGRRADAAPTARRRRPRRRPRRRRRAWRARISR